MDRLGVPTGSIPVGAMLAYEVHGWGEPLVLIHGLATTRIIWRRVLPLLGAHRRLTALDVPGFGASPPAGPGFELEAVADAIAAGLPERRYDLLGHSLGGALAVVLAQRHPEAVRRLVLVAPAGFRPISAPAARIAGSAAAGAIPLRRRGGALADTGWGRRLLMSPGTADPASLPPSEVRAMLAASKGATRTAQALESVARADLREPLAAVVAPVGVIWGERDRVIPGGLEAVLAARPDAVGARVPGTGHIPMMERPERFVAAVEQVLSRAGNIAAGRAP